MKVLLVNSFYHPDEPGGAERVVRRLAEALPACGIEPAVACISPSGRAEASSVNGITVHRMPLRNVYPLDPRRTRPLLKPLWHAIDSANPAMARALARVVDQVRPEVVHTHNVSGFSPRIWTMLRRRGIPVVHTLHDYYLLCPRATMYADGKNCARRHLSCLMYSAVRLRAGHDVSAVVGVSRYILERHVAFGAFGGAARHVIYNPIPPAAVSHRPSRTESRLRLGFLGRLLPTKGLDELLSVCVSLPTEGWTLAVAGSGPADYEERLQRYRHPNISFLGRVDSAAFLRDVDVLVVPSLWNEPMPLVVTEALSAGVPVVASAIGGIPEVIGPGRTGFLVGAGDRAALGTTLRHIIENPDVVRRMRDSCRASVTQFEPGVIAREYAALYRTTAGDRLTGAR